VKVLLFDLDHWNATNKDWYLMSNLLRIINWKIIDENNKTSNDFYLFWNEINLIWKREKLDKPSSYDDTSIEKKAKKETLTDKNNKEIKEIIQKYDYDLWEDFDYFLTLKAINKDNFYILSNFLLRIKNFKLDNNLVLEIVIRLETENSLRIDNWIKTIDIKQTLIDFFKKYTKIKEK